MSTIMGHMFSIRGYRRSHAKIHLRDRSNSWDSLPEPEMKVIPGSIGTDDECHDVEMNRIVTGDDMDDGEPEDNHTVDHFDGIFPFAYIASDIEQIEAYKISVQQRNEQLLRGILPESCLKYYDD